MIRHIVTGEYPPGVGGVAGHTAALAAALAACGETVHVWCPGTSGTSAENAVLVHRELRDFGPMGLQHLSAALTGPQRMLVQWVPHAFGRRSLNLAFCRWLLRRRQLHGDEIDVIVHEPFLPFGVRLKVNAAAALHRLMIAYVLRSAARVWITTPAWERRLRRYSPARPLSFQWLPVFSTIPVTSRAVSPERAASAGLTVGCLPTGEPYTEEVLRDGVLPLLAGSPTLRLVLIGRCSEPIRVRLCAAFPSVADRVFATGCVNEVALSRHLAACDVAVQPYKDGVCGRRTSAMAFLAHGRPLVTTDGRFTEDVWRTSAVSLVPSTQPGRMQNCLERLLSDIPEQARLAIAGRDLYAARFDVRHTAAALHLAIS